MDPALTTSTGAGVFPGRPLVLELLLDPAACTQWSLQQWDLCIRQAARCELLARLCAALEAAAVIEQIPEQPRLHLRAARIFAAKHVRDVDYELQLIHEALGPLGIPVVLLKGAAYRVAALPFAATRVFSDIDILVQREALPDVEAALFARGWVPSPMDAYDQNYYREFMHELPPMLHALRGTTLDIHHTILPPTSRGSPDPRQLLSESLETDGPFRVLSHADMLLHSATHLFHEGEFEHGFRDLLDLRDLFNAFEDETGFADVLQERARSFGLEGPLGYAERYTGSVFGPGSNGPAPGHAWIMDPLFHRGLAPWHPSCEDRWSGPARLALYLRAHYLRMPPRLLLPHLLRKFLNRLPGARPDPGPDQGR